MNYNQPHCAKDLGSNLYLGIVDHHNPKFSYTEYFMMANNYDQSFKVVFLNDCGLMIPMNSEFDLAEIASDPEYFIIDRDAFNKQIETVYKGQLDYNDFLDCDDIFDNTELIAALVREEKNIVLNDPEKLVMPEVKNLLEEYCECSIEEILDDLGLSNGKER